MFRKCECVCVSEFKCAHTRHFWMFAYFLQLQNEKLCQCVQEVCVCVCVCVCWKYSFITSKIELCTSQLLSLSLSLSLTHTPTPTPTHTHTYTHTHTILTHVYFFGGILERMKTFQGIQSIC